MAWTPPTKFTVFFSFLLLAGGLFILIELFFSLTGILPVLALGTFSSTETWGIIGMGLVFLAWFFMFLGVRVKGL
ncbi:MAG: hypothetical protein KGD72_02205 [Candidatus Lokiarchaeota archaeon]|nr:hypothetical protein [Candidatus Lokiarchaeota archaeon]